MRKILSFLMMTLFSVSMFATSITMPATTLDLQSPTMVTTAGWTGEKAYYLDDDVLVVSGYESYKSVAKQTWITFLSTGSSDNTWDALAPFQGSSYYTSAKYATLQDGRYTAYLVKGCDSVWVYGYNNADTKYLTMKIYDVTGSEATSIDDTSVDATYAVDNSAVGGKANGVMKQALNSEKTYLIVTSGKGGSNSRVFEVAFFRHPSSTPDPEPDPEPTTRTLYCKVAQSWWKADGAAVGVYAFGEAGAENAQFPGVRMTAVEGAEDTWKADIDTALYKKVIFARMNPVDEGNQNWGAKTADLTIPADKDLYTITSTTPVWGDPGVTGEWSNYSPSVAPDPQPVLADGFYLIGKIGGVAGWAITDLKAEQKFAQNQENPGEYMLNVTLAEGDELKVVNVLNNEIATWYPGDDNFIVTAAYAGEKTVYFRPDGQGGEGWHRGCIYIAPNPATGISNNAVEGKAVKMIMDAQLLIIRNGKTYNVQGQQLK